MKKWLSIITLLLLVGCTIKEPRSYPNIETSLQQLSLSDDTTLADYFALDIKKAETDQTREGNYPFLLENKNATECILLTHGFAASPYELQMLAKILHEEGLTVYGTRLTGHGTTSEDLGESTKEDWIDSLNIPLQGLQQSCEHVFVSGVSTGATLSLMAAHTHKTDGVITINAPITFFDKRIMYTKIFKYLQKKSDRELEDHEKPYYYATIPTKSVAQLAALIKESKKILSKITTPLLIIQSAEDKRVEPSSAKYILDNIGSEKKELLLYPEGDHVLTTGNKTAQVAKDILEFIERVVR
ncbi:MAG: alpha/beta hydrolase [Nanoarchaeota archaeon]|nr:alpha/beta hydrolase [Nanoarchaeota archaeon]